LQRQFEKLADFSICTPQSEALQMLQNLQVKSFIQQGGIRRGELSTDVIWGKNMKRGREKDGKC
jgi:hypothetical protein